MGVSIGQLLIILLIILVLFGAGRLPQVMTDLSKGLRLFKEGLKKEDRKRHKK